MGTDKRIQEKVKEYQTSAKEVLEMFISERGSTSTNYL